MILTFTAEPMMRMRQQEKTSLRSLAILALLTLQTDNSGTGQLGASVKV